MGETERVQRAAGSRVRRWLRPRRLAAIAVVLVLLALGAFGALYSGVYNVASTDPHLPFVPLVFEYGMIRSVTARAEEVAVPDLESELMVERGFRLFRQHCVQCHGAPGVGRDAVGMGLTPAPANLAYTARIWSAAEIFWITSNGVKMTGMPSWKHKLSEDDLWSLVAFIKTLPRLSTADYRALDERWPGDAAPAIPEPPDGLGDPEHGKVLLQQYACNGCHEIPGVIGVSKAAGPPLGGIARRSYLAGLLPNTRENMTLWIRHPQRVDPLSAMPDLGVTPQDAEDMVAYLITLD